MMSNAVDRQAPDRPAPQRSLVIMLGLGAIGFAVVLIAVALLLAPSAREADFRLELAKAFVQLAVLTLLGGLVAAAIRYVESLRDESRRHMEALRAEEGRRHEYWASLFRDVVAAYNGIKTVRRTLRASGFRSPIAGALTAGQADEFWNQMTALLQSQLALERVGRELATGPRSDASQARRAIEKVEHYVHDIISDWEDHGVKVTEGATSTELDELHNLRLFLAPAKQGFRSSASEPMNVLQDFIRTKLGSAGPGASPTPTLQELGSR